MALTDCVRTDLGSSMTLQECLVDFGNITRVALKIPTGANPFTGVDAATQLTNIEDSAKWSTALGLTAPDNVVLTPKIQSAAMPKVKVEETTLPDGTIVVNRVAPQVPVVFTLYGLKTENVVALRAITGGTIEFMLINEVYETIFKTVTDGTSTPFFTASLVTFTSRGNSTADSDSHDLELKLEIDTVDAFTVADTTSFIKDL